MIAAGLLDRAAEVARSIKTKGQKAQALATVAGALTAGQPSQAAALLAEAISAAQLIHGDESIKDEALVALTNGLVKARQ